MSRDRLERLPPAHLLAGSLCVGLALALLLREAHAGLLLGAVALGLGAPVAREARMPLLACALLLAGLWWGGVRLAVLDSSVLEPEIGRAGLAVVEVTGPARRSEFALRVPVKVRRFGALELDERARLDLPPDEVPAQGAVLEVVATVAAPRESDGDGDFDEAAYLRRQGMHVVLRAGGFRVVGSRGGIGSVADGLRRGVSRSLETVPAGERRAVLAGVVLGEDEGIADDLQDSFRASGLYHLLAVSGQNVAYVVAGTILLVWTLGLPRLVGELAALGTVAAYVLAVGWQPSVVRAGVAGGLASLAWLASRPRDRWYFLLVGAVVLLAWNPYSLLEPGFQLSFSAVAAIFLLVPWIARRLEGYPLPSRLAEVIAVSSACGLVTAPLLWLHFQAIPVYAVLANALAAPVVGPLLGLALAAAALHPLVPEASAALVWLDAYLAAYLAFCARLVGGLPYAEASSLSALGLLGLGTLAAVVAARMRGPRLRRGLAVASLAAALAFVWWLGSDGRPPRPPEGLRITVLDVGQGDAILLEVPEGALLVDQGPPEADVAGQLEELGVERLSALVLTHPQRDHIGGAAEVLRRVAVDLVLDPQIPAPSEDHEAALAAAREEKVPVLAARAGRSLRLGALRVRILWPERPGAAGEDPNAHAVVLVASFGEVDALLTADAEGDVTVPIRPPPVEILKVAHHGSADPRLPELLELVRPRVAVVSVGARNDYGHPTPSTMGALEAFRGLAVYRTDRDGRLIVETDGRRISVTGEG
ncbi:MAG TPA: DNA internalization-related competence protein ComEC/Rec2 [Gaiellaceae bacterium]|nr:DNA internalization-related competence protein ComEC/Rec2 [Gaiellaceae bacterium]